MAADWIKMESNLHEKPEVIRIAADLGKNRFDIVGRLHRLWSWFDSHSSDGHTKGVTSVTLDEIVSCDGFAEALKKVEWLVENLETLSLPKFDRHNGKSAKSRADAADRQRMSRENRDICHTKVVTEARPEKRREEKIILTLTSKNNTARGSLEELKLFAVEIGQPESDGEAMFHHWEANGWRNGSSPSKNWMAGIRKWKSQGWLPSQKLNPNSRAARDAREYPQETLELP